MQSSTTAFAVIPFENSTFGTVVFTLELLVDRESNYPDLLVCGENYLDVRHCLVGYEPKSWSQDQRAEEHSSEVYSRSNSGASPSLTERLPHISTVYSHPEAFKQCERFLSTRLKGVSRDEVSSTSRAAEKVAEEGPTSGSVAISSSLAAETHGLTLLAEDIQDQSDNSTRFFILKNRKSSPEEPAALRNSPNGNWSLRWKTLISFRLPQNPSGILADALQVFKNHGLNITSINSRPSLEQRWHYVFLVELQGRREMDGSGMMNEALEELGRKTKGCKWLGSWEDRAESASPT